MLLPLYGKREPRGRLLCASVPGKPPLGYSGSHMKLRCMFALFLAFAVLPARATPADWTSPLAPFRISDNLYYVGSRDLASYLIVTPQGNILINANLASSPPQIRHSVEALGFHWRDTKILLISHAHYDHVGGAARVLRETHARFMVMQGDVAVVQSGGAADFDRTLPHFPPAHVDRILHDGDTVTLGGVTLTAHKTAGHTRGCTTWTMQTHSGGHPLNVVIVGGWSTNPGVRLVNSPGRPAAYPGIVADFDHTFATLSARPCDIFLGAHGGYFDMLAKLARTPEQASAARTDKAARTASPVWIDPAGYHRAIAQHQAAFHQQLALQQREK